MLNFACWNLTSFSLENVSFLSERFEIFGVVESWTHAESTIDLPDFLHFHLPGTKRKNVKKKKKKKKGRRSGDCHCIF